MRTASSGLIFVRRNHSEIVPGFGILGTQLHRLFQIFARFGEGISTEIQRSQVVKGFGIVGLGGDDLLERCFRLFQISMLEKRHAIGKVVALERALEKRSGERQCLAHAIGWIAGDRFHILQQPLRSHRSLVNLDDHAFLIKQKRCGQAEVAAAVEEVAINNVIDACHIRGDEQSGEGEPFSGRECFDSLCVAGIVHIDANDAKASCREGRSALAEQPQLLAAGRRSCGPKGKQDKAVRGTIAGPMFCRPDRATRSPARLRVR